jgi:hypothetical protein
VSFAYSDMDRLLIERWTDVVGLIEAHQETQDRIEEMFGVIGERLGRWARPHGYEVETEAKYGEFKAAKSSWIDKRRGRRVELVLGGLAPFGYRKVDTEHPYQFVYISGLANFRLKEADLKAFSHALRKALGAEARSWEAPDVDDTDQPLGRYLRSVTEADRAGLIANEDALFEFATSHLPALFALSEVIDIELQKVGR